MKGNGDGIDVVWNVRISTYTIPASKLKTVLNTPGTLQRPPPHASLSLNHKDPFNSTSKYTKYSETPPPFIINKTWDSANST